MFLEFLFQHCINRNIKAPVPSPGAGLNYDVESKKPDKCFFLQIFINPRISKRGSPRYFTNIRVYCRTRHMKELIYLDTFREKKKFTCFLASFIII